jgi:dipeptidyl aminopeptidase/acylaminoacyl peptidase
VEESRVLVRELKSAGGNVQLKIYPEAGHDAWTETYSNPELYEWFMNNRRSA